MNVLSLFAGIGGLELGLERAGMTTVGQVEIDPYCRAVLAKHWPEVPRHDDVRTAGQWWPSAPRPSVDLICGGFPCQPFSSAGLRSGVGDERWGWPWMESVIRVVRPSYVLMENVADILRDRHAFGLILGGLAELGFDAEWGVLSACVLGAPHTRQRLFVVAHAHGQGKSLRAVNAEVARLHAVTRGDGYWRQPFTGPVRMADGIPARVDRLRALGNAVVPQVAEHIGRLIMAAATQGVAA